MGKKFTCHEVPCRDSGSVSRFVELEMRRRASDWQICSAFVDGAIATHFYHSLFLFTPLHTEKAAKHNSQIKIKKKSSELHEKTQRS